MNRGIRRAQAAQERPSAALLRKVLEQREAELAVYRDALFAIVKSQGRVRVAKSEWGNIEEGAQLDIREDDGFIIMEFPKP